jgi:uncharacterized protein
MFRPILFALGWLFFLLGFIGAFLPILPTTPFLLLAAYFFNRSSPRFHQWLLSMPIFGEAVVDWNESKVIRPRAKILCSSMLAISLYFIWQGERPHFWVKIPVTAIIMSVGIFVATRRSFKEP